MTAAALVALGVGMPVLGFAVGWHARGRVARREERARVRALATWDGDDDVYDGFAGSTVQCPHGLPWEDECLECRVDSGDLCVHGTGPGVCGHAECWE